MGSGKTLVIVPQDKTEVVQPGSLKIVHTMGLPQRFSGHIKGHLYIVMDVKLPLSKTLSTKQIDTFKAILPVQIIDENEDENEEEESKMNGNSEKNENKQQNKQQQNGKKNNNKKRKNNKKNKRKNSKSKGMFGGLHGAFGGGGGDNKMDMDDNNGNVSDEDDVMIEECECHSVDGNPKATPASASNYYQDDEDDGDNVQCRQ